MTGAGAGATWGSGGGGAGFGSRPRRDTRGKRGYDSGGRGGGGVGAGMTEAGHRYRRWGGRLFDVVAEAGGAGGVAELAQGLGFNLADALAGDIEFFADLFKRAAAAVAQAEAQL